MRENWRWDSTATASSSQPDISLFWLLLLILLQLLRIRICLVEHLLLSKSSFFPETILFLFTIYVNVTQYHLTSWVRGFEGPVSQLQTWQDHISLQAWQKTTCDVTMQCAPKGGGEMILTILVAQYLSETFILLKKWLAAKLQQNWYQMKGWEEFFLSWIQLFWSSQNHNIFNWYYTKCSFSWEMG